MRHRSASDHGMYWAILQRAFDNWPVTHPFRPTSKDHLHGWLLIESGHAQSVDVETENVDVAKAVAKGIFEVTRREIHAMRIFGLHAGGIRISVPQSMSYEEAGKRKYEQMRADVYEVIETVLGVKVEELKRARVA